MTTGVQAGGVPADRPVGRGGVRRVWWAWPARVDTILGRVSMYALLAGGLGVLAVWSLAGAALGVLPQAPADLAAPLLVCVGASLAANRAAAALLHAPVRHESALVTGLLLYFVMWPSAGAADLAAAAAAACAATVGKYLLVVRGRRLVNPAAFGALVVAIAGIGAPVWWVATPWMLIPVLVLGAAVVWRAGGGEVAAVVALIGIFGTAARLTVSSAAPGEALTTTIVSYPVVFLAFLMATEPLTLPPRRWQRLVVAGVMGVLVCLPVTVDLGSRSLTLGPEAAVVAANLAGAALALAVSGRGAAGWLRIVSVERPTLRLARVELEAARPVRFRAGQYLELTVPGAGGPRGNRRVFSLVNSPTSTAGESPSSMMEGTGRAPRTSAGATRLAVVYRVPDHPSAFKRALTGMVAGAAVRAEGIRGDFVLPDDPREPLLLVARGVGVTPFLSQVADLAAAAPGAPTRDVVLVHLVADPADAVLSRDLSAPGLRVVIAAVEPDHVLEAHQVRDWCPDAERRRAYVSGSPAFVGDARGALRAAGVRRVVTDAFAGY